MGYNANDDQISDDVEESKFDHGYEDVDPDNIVNDGKMDNFDGSEFECSE